MLEVSKHCFYMLHKDAYKVHVISGLIFAYYCCDHICLTDIRGDLSFCPSKMTITPKTKCNYSEMEKFVLVIKFYY